MLSQSRDFVNKRDFTLTERGIDVKIYAFLENHSYSIPYEDVSDETYSYSTSSRYAFWFFVFLGVLALVAFALYLNDPRIGSGAAIAWTIMALPFGIRFYFSRARFTGIRCGGHSLLIYLDLPSKSQVDEFIAELQVRKKTFIETHIGSYTNSIADELGKLAYLRDKGVLSDEEFAKLKEQSIAGSSESRRKLGF